MDEPASPAPEVLTLQSGKPRPISRLQKWIYSVLAVIGIVLIALTFYLMDSTLPGFVIGGMAGAGGSLLAVSFMMLFHRPDR
ncbi:MAG: hypothetical protein AB7O49_03230 [Sphingomonadales bacterium]